MSLAGTAVSSTAGHLQQLVLMGYNPVFLLWQHSYYSWKYFANFGHGRMTKIIFQTFWAATWERKQLRT